MLARHAIPIRALPTVLFLSERSEDVFDLKRRLGDTARLVVGRASGNPGALLRGSAFGAADSVVIDRRGLSPEQRQAIALMIAQSRLACRVLCIDGPPQGASTLQSPSRDVHLGADESPAAYAAVRVPRPFTVSRQTNG